MRHLLYIRTVIRSRVAVLCNLSAETGTAVEFLWKKQGGHRKTVNIKRTSSRSQFQLNTGKLHTICAKIIILIVQKEAYRV
jgi:hypothetical protein